MAASARPGSGWDHDEISVRLGRLGRLGRAARALDAAARRDPLRAAVWLGSGALGGAVLLLRRSALETAAPATLLPFATLAAIVAAGLTADRLGLFRLVARPLLARSAGDRVAVAGALALTALLSGLVNLDVAVVVAVPIGLVLASRRGLPSDRLSAAIALTANATSFLLPTSNVTTLLVLDRTPASTAAFVQSSWIPWLLVTGITLAPLTFLTPRGDRRPGAVTAPATGSGPAAILDLLPLFLIAAAIRALLGGGVLIRGGRSVQLFAAALLAAGIDNLPAAAAIRTAGAGVPWPAVLGLAVGPNLVVTSSLATLISRRIARDAGSGFAVGWFTRMSWLLVPAQLLIAVAGLRLSGAV